MPPQIDIRVQKVEPLYEGYAEPTVRFTGEITNRTSDRVFFIHLQCTIRLRDKDLILCKVPLIIGQLAQNQPQSFEIPFSFSIDHNNAIHELLKHQEFEDVTFELIFNGFCLWNPPNQTVVNYQPITATQTADLPVDKYRRLLSTYYRDLAWISVSRKAYHRLKELMNKTGKTTLDELILTMVEEYEHGRRS